MTKFAIRTRLFQLPLFSLVVTIRVLRDRAVGIPEAAFRQLRLIHGLFNGGSAIAREPELLYTASHYMK